MKRGAVAAIFLTLFCMGCYATRTETTETKNLPTSTEPSIGKKHKLVVFVHGFLGDAHVTWGKFPQLIREDPDLKDFEVYPSRRGQVHDDSMKVNAPGRP